MAERILERFGHLADTLWLVTHREPDFDAFSSMYLVRSILSGGLPYEVLNQWGLRSDGWFGEPGEINWFAPDVGTLPFEHRWPILLAAYAACVDQCRRLSAAKQRALHSVLYAALQRGRPYLAEDSGAVQFFDEVVSQLSDPLTAANPLFDSVLEQSRIFAPELALLDREVEEYERDIRRARRATVFLPTATVPFEQWFGQVKETPLLDEHGETYPVHLDPPDQQRRQADGVYIRDPDCLLFKEWARLDKDNSALGDGFLFTAVAYSDRTTRAAENTSDYFFSLDPERAGNRHGYPVWARLQSQEVHALAGTALDFSKPPRQSFQGRAGAGPAYFHDPWFDGSNYRCTIVVTPNQGTVISPPGHASDLSDDAVTSIVREELEYTVYASDVSVIDFSTSPDSEEVRQRSLRLEQALSDLGPAPAGCLRFCSIKLDNDVDLLKGKMAEQIGAVLWKLLNADRGSSTDSGKFAVQHLLVDVDGVRVWSRYGVAVSHRSQASRRAEHLQQQFREMANVIRDFETLVAGSTDDSASDELVDTGERLVRRVVNLKRGFSEPDGQVVRQFFEASGLEETLELLRDVNSGVRDRTQSVKLSHNLETVTSVQRVIHLIEYVVVATYFAEFWHLFAPAHVASGEHGAEPGWNWGVLVASLLGLFTVDVFNYHVEGRSPILKFIGSWFRRR